MKHLNYFLLGAAGLLLASCSNEDLTGPAPAGDGNVNVTISLPKGFSTRAMNDGYAATQLYVAVYDADNGNALVFEDKATFGANELETTVSMNLANGKTYNMAFFAYASGAFSNSTTTQTVYNYVPSTGIMTVDYSKMTSEGTANDTYDCFFNVISSGVVGTVSTNVSVTLYRPIAQINWGTSDFDESTIAHASAYGESLEYIQTNLVTSAYNQFSFLTGDVTGNPVDITLTDFNAPENQAYPVTPTVYDYLAMQYLLAPKTQGIYDLTLNVNNTNNNSTASEIQNDIVVASVPVQANYQTNIYGALLTDNFNVTVVKSPGWAGSFLEPQDEGEEIFTDLWYNSSTKTYYIKSVTGLSNYINQIVANTSSLSGYTVLLQANLDMSQYSGTYTPFNNKYATFDGQGYTISNLNASATERNPAGFMSYAAGVVQNINFSNATITGNFKAGVLAGDGLCAKINNISVSGSTVTSTPWGDPTDLDDGNNAGGIVGYLSGEPQASVTNCNVSNSTISAYRTVGAIAGRARSDSGTNKYCLVENNTATNVKVIANQNINGGTYTDSGKAIAAGEIVGENTDNSATIQNNTANNVNVLVINAEGAYSVTSLEGLQAIASLGQQNYAGKDITFANPGETIDMNGAAVSAIPFGENSTDFPASFDGNGVTISNFTVDLSNATRAALFNGFAGTFSNITIEKMTIIAPPNGLSGGGLIGYFAGSEISNVKLIDCVIVNTGAKGTNTGAIVGLGSGSFTMSGCSVTGTQVSCNRRAGGLVGAVNDGNGPWTFTNCTATDVTVSATNTDYTAGSILGSNTTATAATFNGCTVSNVTVNGVVTDEAGTTTTNDQ